MQELLSNLWSLEKGHPVMKPVEVVGEFGGLMFGAILKNIFLRALWLPAISIICGALWLPAISIICEYFPNARLVLIYFSTIIYMQFFLTL